jgi:hypothetical protein
MTGRTKFHGGILALALVYVRIPDVFTNDDASALLLDSFIPTDHGQERRSSSRSVSGHSLGLNGLQQGTDRPNTLTILGIAGSLRSPRYGPFRR